MVEIEEIGYYWTYMNICKGFDVVQLMINPLVIALSINKMLKAQLGHCLFVFNSLGVDKWPWGKYDLCHGSDDWLVLAFAVDDTMDETTNFISNDTSEYEQGKSDVDNGIIFEMYWCFALCWCLLLLDASMLLCKKL